MPRRSLPLGGTSIVITRAQSQSGAMERLLKHAGAKVIDFPVIKTVAPQDPTRAAKALAQIRDYDWVVFTSVNGVAWLLKSADAARAHDYSGIRTAVIGPATARKAKEAGFDVKAMGKRFVAESLLTALRRFPLKGTKVLIARAEQARDILPEGLRESGATVDVVAVYRTVAPDFSKRHIDDFMRHGADYVLFTSSSTVNNFATILGAENLARLQERTRFISIGPVTTQTAKDTGLKVSAQATEHDLNGIFKTLLAYEARHGDIEKASNRTLKRKR